MFNPARAGNHSSMPLGPCTISGSMQRLAEGVLTADRVASECRLRRHSGAARRRRGRDDFSVLAGSGCYSRFIGTTGSKSLDPDLRSMVEAPSTAQNMNLSISAPFSTFAPAADGKWSC